MKHFRILKNQDEAVQCLMSLKVLFGMLDEHTLACFGAFELFFEGGNPDLFLFLDESDSRILDASDNLVFVKYSFEGEFVNAKIRFSEIEHYANIIADIFQEDSNHLRN